MKPCTVTSQLLQHQHSSVVQLYEDLYWQNYDDMESNRIELAKQAKREARLAAEAANKEEDLETPIELQQGSGFPGLAARVRYSPCVCWDHPANTWLVMSAPRF